MKRRVSLVPVVLIILAVGAAFLPEAAFQQVVDPIGGARPVLCIFLGAFALTVSLLETRVVALESKLEVMVDAINRQLYGEDYRTIRDAVSILVTSMKKQGEGREVARRELERITGQSFGDDGAAWAAWWEKARPTFRVAKMKDATPRKPV